MGFTLGSWGFNQAPAINKPPIIGDHVWFSPSYENGLRSGLIATPNHIHTGASSSAMIVGASVEPLQDVVSHKGTNCRWRAIKHQLHTDASVL